MKKKIAVVAVVLLALGVAAFAADANASAGKTRNVVFGEKTKVGDQILPEGEYKVLHLVEGSEHTLVFKTLSNNEKVRLKCSVENTGKKADDTVPEFNAVGNDRVLTALVFRGDPNRYTF